MLQITGKAESLKEWVEKGKKETSTSKAISPVITYPAAVNSQKATSAVWHCATTPMYIKGSCHVPKGPCPTPSEVGMVLIGLMVEL